MPNVNMPSDALLDAGDLASVAGPAVSTSGVVTTGSTLNHYRASCQPRRSRQSIDLVVCIGRSTDAMPACKAICTQLVADLCMDTLSIGQLTSIQHAAIRPEAMRSRWSIVRSMSHVVVHSSGEVGRASTRPRDGKIKAAGCGSVGREKS